jgi:hypothetical protein
MGEWLSLIVWSLLLFFDVTDTEEEAEEEEEEEEAEEGEEAEEAVKEGTGTGVWLTVWPVWSLLMLLFFKSAVTEEEEEEEEEAEAEAEAEAEVVGSLLTAVDLAKSNKSSICFW